MTQTNGRAISACVTGECRLPRLAGPVRLLAITCIFALFAGCATVPETGPEPAEEVIEEPAQPPRPPPDPGPAPSPEPEPAPPAEPPRPLKAAVILSDRLPAFDNVARELELLLDRPPLYNLADKSQSPEAAFAAISQEGADVIIAIGRPAALAAIARSGVPVVYCQVFNFSGEDHPVPVKGVSSLPPLGRQLDAWTGIEPDLRSIGTILGEGHENLLGEAAAAAAAHDISFQYRIASSDRETLYLFQRMAPGIDGFWLFPDNRILSLPVLEQMAATAARHGVRIAVFNDALLDMGASVSTAADVADIAATVVAVATRLAAGGAATLPALTPLNDVTVQIGRPPASPPAAAGSEAGR